MAGTNGSVPELLQPTEGIIENTINNNSLLENSKITNEIILNDWYTCEMCNEKMKLQFYLKDHFEKCLENFVEKKPKNYVANNFLLFVKSNSNILPINEMTEILEKVGYTWDDVNNASIEATKDNIRRSRPDEMFFGPSLRNIFARGPTFAGILSSVLGSVQFSDIDESMFGSSAITDNQMNNISAVTIRSFEDSNESLDDSEQIYFSASSASSVSMIGSESEDDSSSTSSSSISSAASLNSVNMALLRSIYRPRHMLVSSSDDNENVSSQSNSDIIGDINTDSDYSYTDSSQ